MSRRVARWLAPAAVGAGVLLSWQGLVTAFDVPFYLVPAPSLVAKTLVQDAPLLFDALLVTLHITALALLLAVVLGVAVALVFVQSRIIEMSLFPYAVLLQVTPIVAIAPLIIIWVKNPLAALVVCATIVAIFPIISNTTLGLRSVDPGLADLFRLYGAGRWQTLVRLRVPSALPYFFAGLRVSGGLALIGAVVAEFVAGTGGTSSGLAYQILQAGLQLNIPRLFAALLLITLAGVAIFALVSLAAHLALRRWHESELAPEP
ncbi:MAG TPA: ABC transporter permease [Burkholderiales bacterium]|nr:ABC transporter permease [Burkholderiales bacterium]